MNFKNDKDKFLQIVDVIMGYPESEPFRNPVDEIKDKAENYYERIKQPMDLNTLIEQIHNGIVKEKKQFVTSLFQIWKNAKDFNSSNHYISKFASKLENRSKRLIRKHWPLCESDELFEASRRSTRNIKIKNDRIEPDINNNSKKRKSFYNDDDENHLKKKKKLNNIVNNHVETQRIDTASILNDLPHYMYMNTSASILSSLESPPVKETHLNHASHFLSPPNINLPTGNKYPSNENKRYDSNVYSVHSILTTDNDNEINQYDGKIYPALLNDYNANDDEYDLTKELKCSVDMILYELGKKKKMCNELEIENQRLKNLVSKYKSEKIEMQMKVDKLKQQLAHNCRKL